MLVDPLAIMSWIELMMPDCEVLKGVRAAVVHMKLGPPGMPPTVMLAGVTLLLLLPYLHSRWNAVELGGLIAAGVFRVRGPAAGAAVVLEIVVVALAAARRSAIRFFRTATFGRAAAVARASPVVRLVGSHHRNEQRRRV